MRNTLYCLLQNRLGALDRVLSSLTYRGFLPEQMVSTIDPKSNSIQLIVTFECRDEKAVEKLVKFINKQIYVIEARLTLEEKHEVYPFTREDNIASLFSSSHARRRVHNANNA